MRKTLITFRCFAGRFKFITAIVGIFLSGAMIALGTTAWYYNGMVREQAASYDLQIYMLTSGAAERVAAYDRQVARLTSDVDTERVVNRQTLIELSEQVGRNADKLDQVTVTARSAAKTAKGAATTASKAATTAKGAAANAAQATIRVTEVPAAVKGPIRQRRVEH